MIHLLLAVVLGTVPVTVLVWRELRHERHNWQKEQARRQDRLAREDVERWTERVAWALATTGESSELDRVRPLPQPTLRHRGPYAAPWFLIVMLWLVAVMAGWMLVTTAVSMLRHAGQRTEHTALIQGLQADTQALQGQTEVLRQLVRPTP